MEITKRDGRIEAFDRSKISRAIEKAFISVEGVFSQQAVEQVAAQVEERLEKSTDFSVEHIQDLVEETLMRLDYYAVAKSFILFRQKRSELRAQRKELLTLYGDASIEPTLIGIQKDFDEQVYSLKVLSAKYLSFSKPAMSEQDALDALVKAAVELASPEAPRWEFIAARFLLFGFYRNFGRTLDGLSIDTFSSQVKYLAEQGLYGQYIIEAYSAQELDHAARFIDRERDKLFTYSGLDLVLKRYVISNHRHVPLETPQQMFLGIALHLAKDEKRDIRLDVVKDFYDILSKMEVTMATPTMANARKPFHQMSSCFIDTVPDSLDGIFRSIDNFAKVSKFGGGMGMYFGKVRANGSAIRGFEGAAGGVIRWIRLANDTAVAVDQLGVRAGAIAVYLDVWHKNLPEFLNLRTNNGDDRMKAHDVFPAVCYPDYFWKLCEQDLDQMWYMMCPHEIFTVKGYHLEDSFGEEWEKRYLDCVADNRISKRGIVLKELIRLILKSAVETGTPFTFNRDAVYRANPNKHAGAIYCSNLCTEIAQNMSDIDLESITVESPDGDPMVVTKTKPGDFVVCNLASLSLGNMDVNDRSHLSSVVKTVVRALDNVISLNFYPLPYAQLTNNRYRSIGLGVSGYHHMLAKNGIRWESEEHLAFVDALFEDINYAAIQASNELAEEKGAYPLFAGSEWETGAYFARRSYDSTRWRELAAKVRQNGMRNAYLLAIAPTSSTSIISGTTAGVDPVMKRFFYEEKKGSMLPRLAPQLSAATWWYYKNAHEIDQSWSVRASGIRQRHIDQAQSMNLYITNDYTMRQVLNLYILAWKSNVKTIYYVRSKSLEVDECESCSS